jgi:predicted TPR repeat methyltransferase
MTVEHADYRRSHQDKGSTYDATLAREAFGNYSESIQKELIARFVKRTFGGRVPRYMDFACGTGRMTGFLAGMSDVSYGVDVSESMMSNARQKWPQTTFFLRDMTKEDLGIEPVNLVSAFRFFGNAQDSLRHEALAAIRRHLVPNGFLILNNHRNSWSILYRMHRLGGGTDFMDFSYGTMRRLLRSGGFEIVQIRGIAWWCMLARQQERMRHQSTMARMLEPLSGLPPMAPICPDMLVIARKLG